jgi:predicted RNA-binding Zn-ribbon protein involved in translation (DUF1610 family)
LPLALYKSQESDTHPSHQSEVLHDSVSFKIHKFNCRPKPKRNDRILIISCFSEFGCETVGVTHCIPKLLKRFPGLYIIAMGWYGRTYLYQHLVDEYWEIDEKYMHLRDRTFAFHHRSSNLKNIEECAAKHGTVIPSSLLGKYSVGNTCKSCGAFWNEWRHATINCPQCTSTNVVNSLFGGAESYSKTASPIPKPSQEKLNWASTIVTKPSVGIFARGRKTYGRNLTPEFYISLIQMVQKLGYNPIWLGEKQSTQPCPVDGIFDFSRCEESRDLEKTLAIICNCSFTIQYWTASSRLAGLMGVPFLLFESPEQIYCSGHLPGQEGRRLELTTFGKKKVCIAHYLDSVKEEKKLLFYTREAILQMQDGNFSDMITELVTDMDATKMLQDQYYEMIQKVNE